MKNLILDYIKVIKKEDIYNFGIKNNIKLNDEELNNLFLLLQRKNILDYTNDEYYDLICKNVSSKNANKIYKLFLKYKKRYENYL